MTTHSQPIHRTIAVCGDGRLSAADLREAARGANRASNDSPSPPCVAGRNWASHVRQGLILVALTIAVGLSNGCSSQRFLIRRDTPANPLALSLQITSNKGPQISQRTTNVLRRFALSEVYARDPAECLVQLQTLLESEVDGELVYSIAELAYILGKRAENKGDQSLALDMYGVSVSNAYMYLFSVEFDLVRNPYDPQFRGACDLYNESLESTLRLVSARGQLHPGRSYKVTTGKQTYEVATVTRGNWNNEDFERFEFVSDFKLDGLPSSGLTYGLGVPLIAVRKKGDPSDPREKFYPDGLSFPVTALLRVVKPGSMPGAGAMHRHHCVLELHDPLAACDLTLAGRVVPLQTDLSTSLAYFLDSPQFRQKDSATQGLLNPQKTEQHRGIYMLEPFDPTRIPVVMVHGLWSSPVTWMPMFNDLRSFPELRKNYQFWFYQYPTGQPFWLSATQMREDLDEMRRKLDPEHRFQALDQTVLVGHSMGGLVSRMQTIDSRDQFWQILSDEPFEELQGEPEDLTKLRKAAFFTANKDIRRVVTIGTPHHGSSYANNTTRWLGSKLITLPTMMVATGQNLVNKNPGVFRNADLLINNTSIDSLSPESPVFPAMLRAPRASWITYHNIVGLVPTKKWFGGEAQARDDGIVEYESAHADDAISEVIVASEHQTIHRNPKAILEVRRILQDHLEQVRSEYSAAQRIVQLDGQKPAGPVRPASPPLSTPAKLISSGAGAAPPPAAVKARN